MGIFSQNKPILTAERAKMLAVAAQESCFNMELKGVVDTIEQWAFGGRTVLSLREVSPKVMQVLVERGFQVERRQTKGRGRIYTVIQWT